MKDEVKVELQSECNSTEEFQSAKLYSCKVNQRFDEILLLNSNDNHKLIYVEVFFTLRSSKLYSIYFSP